MHATRHRNSRCRQLDQLGSLCSSSPRTQRRHFPCWRGISCEVLKPRADFYAGKKLAPEDVLFTVEVADSSLSYDCNVKLPRYAAAGIPEVWIEDLKNDRLLVCRDLANGQYQTILTLSVHDSIAPIAFPDCSFNVGELISPSALG